MSKHFLTLALVTCAKEDIETFFKSHIKRAISLICDESFFSPRKGTGVRYGESVSNTILDKSIFFNGFKNSFFNS